MVNLRNVAQNFYNSPFVLDTAFIYKWIQCLAPYVIMCRPETWLLERWFIACKRHCKNFSEQFVHLFWTTTAAHSAFWFQCFDPGKSQNANLQNQKQYFSTHQNICPEYIYGHADWYFTIICGNCPVFVVFLLSVINLRTKHRFILDTFLLNLLYLAYRMVPFPMQKLFFSIKKLPALLQFIGSMSGLPIIP